MSRFDAFSRSAPKLWTVPAGAPFLEILADSLASSADLEQDPSALADALIYVPNRRSARALAFALHNACGGERALLMPEIRALGDLETDDAPPGLDGAFDVLPPGISDEERVGELMRLVTAWYAGRGLPLPATAAFATAQELAALLDAGAMAGGVDWAQLPDLVEGEDLAGHWAQSVQFLSIITQAWPAYLKEIDRLDPLARRLAAAALIAEGWTSTPPSTPVIIAGSTGATPASRQLMAAALTLPLGRVVMPGLDPSLGPAEMALVAEEPSHPQHALINCLHHLGAAPSAVPTLAHAPGEGPSPRRALVQESLSPAALTGDWRSRLAALAGESSAKEAGGDMSAAFARRALDGLDVVACRDETEEALVAACLLRAQAEQRGETAALVCPDSALARRVAIHLRRWGLAVSPSEGIPVLRTPAGASLDALLSWITDPADPVKIASLLRAPHAKSHAGADAFERYVLRGARWWDDLDDLLRTIDARMDDPRNFRAPGDGMRAPISAMAAALSRIASAFTSQTNADLPGFLAGLGVGVSGLLDTDRLWRGEGGAATARIFDALTAVTKPLGALTWDDWHTLIRALARDIMVVPEPLQDARLSIWGPLEARLQRADHLILAGLNDGVWPRQAPANSFLPRKLASALGMEDPETLTGLAAHDFAGLACAPRVTLTYSRRRDDAPAVASRWVWRLETLVRGALGSRADAALGPDPSADPRLWARALHTPLRRQEAGHAVPTPRPPVSARPARLSVTRIETLQRDPYAIYAEKILSLAPLARVGDTINARERGTAVHRALERFELDPAMGSEGLSALLDEELKWQGEALESRLGRRAILARMAVWYVDWHTGRQAGLAGDPAIEVKGQLTLPGLWDGGFTLTAVADRIEPRPGGGAAIIDFKTGDPPSDKTIAIGFAPQLPLQAAMLGAGAFEGLAASQVDELAYVAVKAQPLARTVGPGKDLQQSPGELADGAMAGLARLLRAYGDPARPYLCEPRIQFVKHKGDYTRLARRDEWSSRISDE